MNLTFALRIGLTRRVPIVGSGGKTTAMFNLARALPPPVITAATVQMSSEQLALADQHFRLDEFADTMRSRVVSVFSNALASAGVPVLDVAARYQELGDALLPLINPAMTSKYGLEIPSFIVENVSLPPEVEQAIDKRSSMSAIGNLNDYVKFQMAESMTKGEGGGMANSAAQLGAGLAMGQQMMAAMASGLMGLGYLVAANNPIFMVFLRCVTGGPRCSALACDRLTFRPAVVFPSRRQW